MHYLQDAYETKPQQNKTKQELHALLLWYTVA